MKARTIARKGIISARQILAALDFRLSTRLRRPYFGSFLKANQLNKARIPHMKKVALAAIESNPNSNFLEIGSWAGMSAVMWARVLKESGGKGKLFCVDPWDYYESEPDRMRAAGSDKIYNLFLHNIKYSGYSNLVVPIRKKSDQAYEELSQLRFGLIYVDGDHAYSSVIKDLRYYNGLLKDKGIICGDDFELESSEVDENTMLLNREKDCIKDPRTGRFYHPGVTLALNEFFGAVTAYHGFWMMKNSPFSRRTLPIENYEPKLRARS